MENCKWQALFTKFGFMERNGRESRLIKSTAAEENTAYLADLLTAIGAEFEINNNTVTVKGKAVTEERWAAEMEKRKGSTGVSMFPDQLELRLIDPYVSGLVVQLNRLGFHTVYSCDGHGVRRPYIEFTDGRSALEASVQLKEFTRNVVSQGRTLRLPRRELLPEVAERLAELDRESVGKFLAVSGPFVSQDDFENRIEKLLGISGESGNEREIRLYVMSELQPMVDWMDIDAAGNVLAEKRFGPGPVVLLNAHLDTVEPFEPGRRILKNSGIWSSSAGILGADDRAGIGVILSAMETLSDKRNTRFEGTIKVIFSVEEEIGLCGARDVASSFLWDVDMAFVVDRRGNSDIVVSRGGTQPFCSDAFCQALNSVTRWVDMQSWKQVAGGSSDTAIWAAYGIDSVNLSAGYQDEHTERETLDIDACYGTYNLLMEFLLHVRSIYWFQNRPERSVKRQAKA